jgi:dihydroorotase-like cyclic amidohydrolase
MPRQQAAQNIQAAAGGDWDHDADGAVRVPGGIGLSLGGEEPGRGEKGGAEQQVSAERHGGEIQVCLKNFSIKSRKTSRKKILFFIHSKRQTIFSACQREGTFSL